MSKNIIIVLIYHRHKPLDHIWKDSYRVTCFLCGLRYATLKLFSALSVPRLYNTSPLAAKESAGRFSS
jgi:hypothetical protein